MKILKSTLLLVFALCCQNLVMAQCAGDVTPPIITVPDDITIDCDEDWPPVPTVTCWDDCDQALIPTFTFWYVDNKCGMQSMILLWAATDQAGNSTSATQVVMQCDISPPVFNNCPPDVTVSCEDGVPAPDEVVADDVCDGVLIPVMTETSAPGDCPEEFTVTRTWTATDSNGNSTDCVQVITVVDDTAPVITGYGPNNIALEDMTVECDNIPEPMTANTTDNCDEDVEVVFTEKIIPGLCEDSYMIHREYEAVDNCGNTSPVDEQTLTVVDTTAPELVFDPSPQTNCNMNWSSSTYTVTQPGTCTIAFGVMNLIDTAVDSELRIDNVQGGGVANGSFETGSLAPWTNVGNSSVQLGGTVGDYMSRSFTSGAGQGTIEAALGLSSGALDALVGNATDGSAIYQSINANVGDEISFDWRFFANDGLFFNDFAFVVICQDGAILLADHLNPTGTPATCLPADITVECDEIPDALTPSGTDNCDNDVDISFSETSSSWSNCEYTLYRTWTATDNCGNSSSHTQEITVTDSNAPVFSSLPADMSLDCTDPIPPAATLTAEDVCSGSVPVYFYDYINPDCPGQYELVRYWYAYDDCGNLTEHTQVISVSDTNGPTIIHSLDLNITVECDAIPAAESLTATANCSDAFVSVSEVILDDFCGNDYTYILYRLYVATDECGNTSSVTQTINVMDTTAPTFDTLPADADIDCPNLGGGEPDEVSASDNCDPEPNVWYYDNYQDCAIHRTWYAQDNCGNLTTHLQVLSFNDEEAPTFTNLPSNGTASCEDVPGPAEVGAEDNCSAPFVSLDEKILPGSCPNNYTLLRTWTAIDACDNVATHTQVITVYDNTDPTWDQDMPSNIDHPCDEPLPAVPSISASDNCGAVTMTYNEEFHNYIGCEGFYTRHWSAADECGNSIWHTQTITLVDDEAPEFFFDPADDQVECLSGQETGYSTYVHTFSQAGTCILAFGSMNAGDFIVNSTLQVDNVQLNGIQDGSFENGAFSPNWTATGTGASVSTVNPTDGTYHANISSGDASQASIEAALGLAGGALDALNAQNATDGASVHQTITVAAGDVLTFDWNFISGEFVSPTQGFNDFGFVALCQNGAILLADVQSLAGTVGCDVADLVVECDDIPAPWDAPVSDNCDSDIFVSYNETSTPGSCANAYTLTRVWTAYDNCGNSTTVDQVISVIDTTAPEFVDFPADEILYCNPDVPPVVSPTAVDNCDEFVDITFSQTIEYGVSFGSVGTDVVTRTWTATDNCGNSTTESQQITLVADCPGNGCVTLFDFLDAPNTMSTIENGSNIEFHWNVPEDAIKAQARISSTLGTSYYIIHDMNFPKYVPASFFQAGIEYSVEIRYASQVTPCIIASQWSGLHSFMLGTGTNLVQNGNPFEANSDDARSFDLGDISLSIFPNPNNGNFTIETDMEDYAIEVYDVSGKMISAEGNFYNGQNQIELNGYAKGVYVLRIYNDSQSKNTRFVIR